MDDLMEKRRYWHLTQEALGRTRYRIRLGKGYGPVVRLRNVLKIMHYYAGYSVFFYCSVPYFDSIVSMNYKMYICHNVSRWSCYPNQI